MKLGPDCSDNFPLTSSFLIVDDSAISRLYLRNQLRTLGFENVIEGSNGEEALEILTECFQKDHRIDLIISDCEIPIMDGLGLAKIVKEHPHFKGIPFLMVSTEVDIDLVVQAFCVGADVMAKPFDESILQDSLRFIWKWK